MIARCLRHRAPVLWVLLPFMGGVVAGKILPWPGPVGGLLGGAIVASLAAIVAVFYPRASAAGSASATESAAVVAGVAPEPASKPAADAPAPPTEARRFLLWAGALGVAVFLSGYAAYGLHRARLADWEKLPPREARLTVRIERTFPAVAEEKRVSGIARVVAAETHLRDLPGQRLYFSLNKKAGEPAPVRSAELTLIGLLETLPHDAPVASFEGYLTAAGLNFRLTRGRLLTVVRAPGAYARFCEWAQQYFGAILSRGIEHRPALAGALRAMMLGQKQELTEAQNTQFLQSGTMHLFAISGLHIAVIAVALHGLLALLRLPRGAQIGLGLIVLWLYVDITGGSPSAVRAYLMIALVQIAFVLRLPVNPVATLALAALVTLVADPMQLFGASFQMSYGIVAAIVLLGRPLADVWMDRVALFRDLPRATWAWHHRGRAAVWRWLVAAAAYGVATTLVSTVSGVVFFQLFTPGGLLANLLLIPASSVVIVAGFLSLLSGAAGLGAVSVLCNYAAAFLLALMEWGIGWMLKIPGFFWRVEFGAAWIGFSVFAIVLAAMLHGYARQWAGRAGGFWPPFVLTVLALVLLTRFG